MTIRDFFSRNTTPCKIRVWSKECIFINLFPNFEDPKDIDFIVFDLLADHEIEEWWQSIADNRIIIKTVDEIEIINYLHKMLEEG